MQLTAHEYTLRLKRNQTKEELKFYRILKKCVESNFPELTHGIGKQVPIRHPRGFYVLDFYIGSIKMAFEIDGGYHWKSKQLDKALKRDSFLEYYKNIKVLHLPNSDINNKRYKKRLILLITERIQKRIETIKWKKAQKLEPSLPLCAPICYFGSII